MNAIVTRGAVPLGSAELPKEFRLFKAGANPTTRGTDLFDAQAARAVMTAYRRQGVDLMIDLNHDSLDSAARRQRSDAGDAMGWFKLEVRRGELWAVDVRWTPGGEARLRAKKQRYVSPAFMRDASGRVVELVNVGLVAMPATHEAPELIAASRLGRTSSAVISTRVPVALRARIYEGAARSGVQVGAYVRGLLLRARGAGDVLDQLIALLGLSADADAQAIKAAVESLLSPPAPAGAPPAELGATAENAEVQARARGYIERARRRPTRQT